MQADGGLAGAGRALDADGVGDVGAHDLVLLGLDGGDDVAHRADAGALDLARRGSGAAAAGAAPVRVGEVLVLVGGEPARSMPNRRRRATPSGSRAAGAVEGAGDVGAPVHDDGVAGLVGDVAAADVPAFAVGVVGAAEEQGRRRVVDQGRRAAVERRREVLGGDACRRPGRTAVERAFPHVGEVAAGREQVGLLGGEHVARVSASSGGSALGSRR